MEQSAQYAQSVLIAHFVHTFWDTTHFVHTVYLLYLYRPSSYLLVFSVYKVYITFPFPILSSSALLHTFNWSDAAKSPAVLPLLLYCLDAFSTSPVRWLYQRGPAMSKICDDYVVYT
jgi:hypothetical protein